MVSTAVLSPQPHCSFATRCVRISIKFFVSLTKVYCIVLISTTLWNLTQFVTAWISVYSGIWWLSRKRVKLCLVSCNIPQKYRVSRVWKGVYQTRTLHHCSLKFYYTLHERSHWKVVTSINTFFMSMKMNSCIYHKYSATNSTTTTETVWLWQLVRQSNTRTSLKFKVFVAQVELIAL